VSLPKRKRRAKSANRRRWYKRFEDWEGRIRAAFFIRLRVASGGARYEPPETEPTIVIIRQKPETIILNRGTGA
jgi:hypothetical protein